MKQSPLVDENSTAIQRSHGLVPIPGSVRALSTLQRRFNALLERLGALRAQRERWQRFAHTHDQRVALELLPAAARLREQQIALARQLDRNLTHPALGKRACQSLREQLLTLLAELLEEQETADLVALHDRHADLTRADEQRFGFELLRSAAADLAIDVEAYDGEANPETFTAWVDRELGGGKSPPRRPGGKTRAREREAAALAESGTRALRMMFRRLASTLHPDREPDPQEQRRKTALMQELNVAYSSGDLLRVLELQQTVNIRAAGTLAALSDEELQPYLHLLEVQAKRLREEIDALIAPFAAAFSDRSPRSLTPGRIQQSFEQALAEIRHAQRLVTAELERYADAYRLMESQQPRPRTRRQSLPRGTSKRSL